MGLTTEISWCDATINPWWGCTKVHAGCDHCYAEVLDNRFGESHWGNDALRRYVRSAMSDLRKLQKKGAKEGRMITVFIGSMMDIFEKSMPLEGYAKDKPWMETGNLRNHLMSNIFHGSYPNIRFLFLTKRPSNINKYIPAKWVAEGAPDNVWFGTSVVDQSTFDNLVPQLLKVNGNRFLSMEPQLDYINANLLETDGIHWVIQGGESGSKRRPFNVEWAYDMRKQCRLNNVPYFFKQIDKVIKPPADLELEKNFPWGNKS